MSQKTMTAAQIVTRLEEIAREQSEFDARDFDQELSQAIVNGGDVDALEEQHLQAERLARRLRVERQALEARLPDAQVEEAVAQLGPLRERHGELMDQAGQAAAKAGKAWETLEAAIEEYQKARSEAFELHRQGTKVLSEAKAHDAVEDMQLGAPVSPQLQEVGAGMVQHGQTVKAVSAQGFGGYLKDKHQLK
ncbi:hypothetical protein RSO41_14120 [Halomonas sp. I1]|uniref:hypothetical protein n=1 Tax=Halomonas sp. I1 TaxID=393536 RepID=UPI0028DDD46D|nr:hypothetical protein [Halomonas sp. I1]MDT8895790.1 hypothetical protein [Halomonas sp. I1]